jgi:monoamine oxidase
MRTSIAPVLEDAVASVAAGTSRATRRGLITRAGAGAIALSALGRLTPAARAAAAQRIVVVGAGLAGLTCAYRLKQAGYTAQVYEASDRLGGRCWSIRGAFRGTDRRARR